MTLHLPSVPQLTCAAPTQPVVLQSDILCYNQRWVPPEEFPLRAGRAYLLRCRAYARAGLGAVA